MAMAMPAIPDPMTTACRCTLINPNQQFSLKEWFGVTDFDIFKWIIRLQ
jgi:hypothetical protein